METGYKTDARRRRYCRYCGERISQSATRCHQCRRLTLSWKVYLLISILGIVTLFLLLRYLGLL